MKCEHVGTFSHIVSCVCVCLGILQCDVFVETFKATLQVTRSRLALQQGSCSTTFALKLGLAILLNVKKFEATEVAQQLQYMTIYRFSDAQSGFETFKMKAIPTLLSLAVLVALRDSFYPL